MTGGRGDLSSHIRNFQSIQRYFSQLRPPPLAMARFRKPLGVCMTTILPRIAILFAVLIAGASPLFAREAFPGPQARLERYRVILKLISQRQYQQAADECRALIKSDPDFSKPYGKLVFIAGRSGQLDQAEIYFEKLSQTNPRAFYSLGLIHNERKEHQAAIDHQIRCLTALPDFPPAAAALAQAAHLLKKHDDAEKFFLSQPAGAALAFGLGRLYLLQRKHDLAMDRIEQALRLNPQFFEATQEKASLYQSMGRNAEAVAICEELLREVNEETDPEKRFHLLNLKTGLGYELGQTVLDMTDALRLGREYGLIISDDAYLSRIGTIYWRMNYFSKALGYYQQALEISRAGDRRFLSNYLGNIGLVYSGLGNLSKAAESYQQAIDAARAATPPNKSSLINFLINLSGITVQIGQSEQARALLEEATQVLDSSRNASLEYRLQGGWAAYHARIGNLSESLKFNQAALQIVRESKDLARQGECLYRIGDAHLGLRENAAAIAAYEEALAIGRQIQAPSTIWKAEAGLARSWQRQQPERALQHYRRAIEAIENTRGRQTSPEEKTVFFQDKTEIYERAVLLLVLLHRRDASKKYDAEAFHLAERARARALLDSLGETAAQIEQSLDKTLRDRQREIQQRLSGVEEQMIKTAADKTRPPNTRQKLEADLLRAVNDYTDWRQQVRLRNPRVADLTLPEPFTLELVQELLRSDG